MDKIKKILSPGHSKDEEAMYGSGSDHHHGDRLTGNGSNIAEPLHSTPAANKEHGIARQILNPGGDKYDDTRYGTTATTDAALASGVPSTGEVAKRNLRDTLPRADSDNATIRSGIVGSQSQPPTDSILAESGLASSGNTTAGQSVLPDRSVHQSASTTTGSHLGRDAALAGGATGAAGLGAYEADRTRGEQDITGSSSIAREAPFTHHTHQGHGHEYTGDPCPPGEEPSGPHFTHGPHVTDTANRLDPHVPGEYPGATGVDVHPEHRFGRDAGLAGGVGAAGVGAYELEQSRQQPTSTIASTQGAGYDTLTDQRASQHGAGLTSLEDQRAAPPSTHHYGRDAAVAGGVGAAGVGAYELGSDRNQGQSGIGSSSNGPASDTIGPHKSNLMNVVDPRVQPNIDEQRNTADSNLSRAGQGPNTTASTPYGSQAVTSEVPQKEHHYGRDAAVAGGAGGLGVGAYELGKDRDQSQQYGQQTSQQSSLQDAAHRHAQQSIAPEPEQPHHYTRDAAVAGGATGAGVGAYELGQHRDQTSAPSQQYGQQTGSADPLHDAAYRHAQQSIAPEPEQQQHHYGRDAALVGGGAAATGGAAYAIDHEKEEKLAKERAKEAEKAQHQHEKDLAHQRKEHQHEMEKREKEAEHDTKKEKSGGLFGFLHKNKDSDETPEDGVVNKSSHQREAEVGGVAGASTTAAAYGEDRHHHNKLHKDPPAKVQQELEAKAAMQGQQGIVYEPHTGLPMNVGKYGSGEGGTDAGPQHGYHNDSTGYSTGQSTGRSTGL